MARQHILGYLVLNRQRRNVPFCDWM